MLRRMLRRNARWWSQWGALLLTAAASFALLFATIRAHRSVARASDALVRGELERCVDKLNQILMTRPPPPRKEYLEEALLAARPLGLRYVAIVSREPDGSLTIVAEAGQPLQPLGWPEVTKALPPGTVLLSSASESSHARLYGLPLPGRGPLPPGIPPPPSPRRRLSPVLDVDLDHSLALKREARQSLVLGVLVSAGLLMMGVALRFLQKRSHSLEERLSKEGRLAELGQMSAVVAHEIKNPLASLKGHAELLVEAMERLEDQVPEVPAAGQARLKAERVLTEAKRLERLTRDLLEFVRSGVIRRQQVDAADLLRRAVSFALGPRSADAIRITLGELPTSFPMDGERMEQVLQNLLRNALEASTTQSVPGLPALGEKEGPRPAIKLPLQVPKNAPHPVEARAEMVGTDLVFSIRDYGPGIPDGEEERIFEPFYTMRTRGTGLGLAVTRRIVELHGGHIIASTVKGDPKGGGALFNVFLPEQPSG